MNSIIQETDKKQKKPGITLRCVSGALFFHLKNKLGDLNLPTLLV